MALTRTVSTCAQALRRLTILGFPSDSCSLQHVPAVSQVRTPATQHAAARVLP